MTFLAAVEKGTRLVGPPLPVRTVIFDLDGTLIDTEPRHRTAFRAALAALGHPMDERLYNQLIGLATPDRVALLIDSFGTDFPAAAFITDYYRRKHDLLATGMVVKPGAFLLLAWPRARRIPVAVATSSSARTARLNLTRAGLGDRFAEILTRDDGPRRKPHPDLFLCAAAALGTSPEHCLVIEDSAPGIEAAHAAGMIPVLVPDIASVPDRTRRKSFAVLPDLNQVRIMLAGS